jgi:hypothetical protein
MHLGFSDQHILGVPDGSVTFDVRLRAPLAVPRVNVFICYLLTAR